MMREKLLAALCVAGLAVAGASFAQTATDPATEAVVKLEDTRRRAMVSADAETLQRLFAADCVYIHSNGIAQKASEVVTMLTRGEIRYLAFDVESVEYRSYGTTVVGNGVQTIQLSNDGKPFTSRSRYTVVYANSEGAPRLVSYQSTSLPEIKMQETRP